MKEKIVGICVCMLVIATALPAVGTINVTVDEKTTTPFSYMNTPIRNTERSFLQGKCVVWDNHVEYIFKSIAAQDDPPDSTPELDAFPADDFQFDENTDVGWVFWHMLYYGCNYAEGPKDYHFDWNITFYVDDGSGYRPGSIHAGPFTIADADIYKGEELENTTANTGRWMGGFGVVFPEPVTFLSSVKYWISIYSIGAHFPQSFWCCHNETTGGILLHDCVWKSPYYGYLNWTNSTEAWGAYGAPFDMNFILGGELLPLEITLKKGLGITATIKNLLPEPYNQTNITVTFTTIGGFVLNRTKTFFFEQLNVSASETMKLYPIGFGKITIEVNAISKNAAAGRANTSGFLILFFVI
jgi:hypothetical protein